MIGEARSLAAELALAAEEAQSQRDALLLRRASTMVKTLANQLYPYTVSAQANQAQNQRQTLSLAKQAPNA